MNSLYITSVERYSGKTAVCLALGRYFIKKGQKVGYLKPLSVQPWRIGNKVADEDAAFVKEVLNIQAETWELSPVVVTPELLQMILMGDQDLGLMDKVHKAIEKAAQGHDLLLLEGGGSLREGYAIGLPTPDVAKEFGSNVLVVAKYRGHMRLIDDILAAEGRLGESMVGVIINRVPADVKEFVDEIATPYLEEKGVKIYGSLPEVRGIAALTVGELAEKLKANILTETKNPDALVENLTVGAMTQEAALSRFRKQRNKAVITGGDRTDIQLAALETSTTCLVLTGNLKPSPLVVRQADQFGVPVLLVRENTMETVDLIDQVFGKTRLGQSTKLEKFEELVLKNVDLGRLSESVLK